MLTAPIARASARSKHPCRLVVPGTARRSSVSAARRDRERRRRGREALEGAGDGPGEQHHLRLHPEGRRGEVRLGQGYRLPGREHLVPVARILAKELRQIGAAGVARPFVREEAEWRLVPPPYQNEVIM